MTDSTTYTQFSQSDAELADRLIKGQDLSEQEIDRLYKAMVENKALRIYTDQCLALAQTLAEGEV